MDPVSNLIPPQLSSNYGQPFLRNPSSSVPCAHVVGTPREFNANSSGFRMDSTFPAQSNAGHDQFQAAPSIRLGRFDIVETEKTKALTEMFKGENERKLQAAYEDLSMPSKDKVLDLALGLSILNKMSGTAGQYSKFNERFLKYIIQDYKLDSKKGGGCAFYAWTDKNEKLHQKIIDLKVDIYAEVKKRGFDYISYVSDNIVVPAVIKNAREKLGERFPDGLEEKIKENKGMANVVGKSILANLDDVAVTYLNKVIGDDRFDMYIQRLVVALGMTNMTVFDLDEHNARQTSTGTDQKKN